MKETFFDFTYALKKVSPLYVFEEKRSNFKIKKEVNVADTISQCTYFWNTVVPLQSKNSHNVVQFNLNADKFYLPLHILN